MITVFGEGRGFRVVWLLEEMGLPYQLRRVDLRTGVENDPEFLAINPAGFIPALVDGEVTMVEAIAIIALEEFGHQVCSRMLMKISGQMAETNPLPCDESVVVKDGFQRRADRPDPVPGTGQLVGCGCRG